jgi:hypothetical protein
VADSETLTQGKHPRSTPAILFSPSVTLVSPLEAKGGLNTDSVLKRACHISILLTIALATASRFATDNVSDRRVAAARWVDPGASGSSRLSVDREKLPVRASHRAAQASPPKPVLPDWFTGMRLRAVIPNGAFDEALVVQSPAPDWLASLLGGRFDNTSFGVMKPLWLAVLLGVHATTSERPGALVSSWYTAPWLRQSISFKLKPDWDYILAQWSPTASSSVDAVNGAHLELRSTSELCRNDKLVAAHHLCALLLAYVEKEPASFGAA